MLMKQENRTHICVKLANEAREIVVLEESRQGELRELGRRPNHEACSLSIPWNDFLPVIISRSTCCSLFIAFLYQSVSLGQEWSGGFGPRRQSAWTDNTLAAHTHPLLGLTRSTQKGKVPLISCIFMPSCWKLLASTVESDPFPFFSPFLYFL